MPICFVRNHPNRSAPKCVKCWRRWPEVGVKIGDDFTGGSGKAKDDRPWVDVRIDVTNAAEAADWLRSELGKGELSGIFLRENMLVHTPRIGEDGYIDPAKLGLKDAGPAQVRPIATPEIKALIETRYNITRWQGPKDEKEQVRCLFPVNAANSA